MSNPSSKPAKTPDSETEAQKMANNIELARKGLEIVESEYKKAHA